MARSAPIVHQPTLRIGLEGLREFRVSKSEDYPAYPQREISSARPGGRYRPSSVTTGRAVEGPLLHRSESRDRYSGLASPPATSAASSGGLGQVRLHILMVAGIRRNGPLMAKSSGMQKSCMEKREKT